MCLTSQNCYILLVIKILFTRLSILVNLFRNRMITSELINCRCINHWTQEGTKSTRHRLQGHMYIMYIGQLFRRLIFIRKIFFACIKQSIDCCLYPIIQQCILGHDWLVYRLGQYKMTETSNKEQKEHHIK